MRIIKNGEYYRFSDQKGLHGPIMTHKLSDSVGLTDDGYLLFLDANEIKEILFGSYKILYASNIGEIHFVITKGGVCVIADFSNDGSTPEIIRYKLPLGDKIIGVEKCEDIVIVETKLSSYRICPDGSIIKFRKK